MMKFISKLSIALLYNVVCFLPANSQIYEVDSIYFPVDTALDNFLKKNEMRPASTQGLMKLGAKEEFGGLRLQIEKGKDQAVLEPVNGKSSQPVELKRVGETLYRRVSSNQRYEEIDFADGRVQATFGAYRQLPKPENAGEDYERLLEKYGEQFPSDRVVLVLKQTEGEINSANKKYRVTDVELVVNEDVVSFGKEHVEMFAAYSQGYEDNIRDIYEGMTYNIQLTGSRMRINGKGDGGSFSFSGGLRKVKDGVYRLEVLKSYYDFYLDGELEDFSVNKIVYSDFIAPEEAYHQAEGYDQLQEKYGEKLPYNTVVQQVVEIE